MVPGNLAEAKPVETALGQRAAAAALLAEMESPRKTAVETVLAAANTARTRAAAMMAGMVLKVIPRRAVSERRTAILRPSPPRDPLIASGSFPALRRRRRHSCLPENKPWLELFE